MAQTHRYGSIAAGARCENACRPNQNRQLNVPSSCHSIGDKLVQQELIYEKLPADIAERHVLLMDPILGTGNTAARAIEARVRACELCVHAVPLLHGRSACARVWLAVDKNCGRGTVCSLGQA